MQHTGEKRNIVLVGKPGGKDYQEELDISENNIKLNIREIIMGDMDQIHQAHDRDSWRTLSNKVMGFGFHEILGFSRVAEGMVTSQEGNSSKEMIQLIGYNKQILVATFPTHTDEDSKLHVHIERINNECQGNFFGIILKKIKYE